MDQSLWDIIQQGGIPMYVLMGCSVLAVAVGLERLTAHWGFLEKARSLTDTVTRCLDKGAYAEGRTACERSTSPLAEVFLVGYERHGRTKHENVASAAHRERKRVTTEMKRWVWVLGTVGALAPFIGLAGTVVGVINAFLDVDVAGAQGQEVSLHTVSGSIAEALWVTAAGIVVAVEAVVIYNFLSQRIAKAAGELTMLTDEFLEALESGEADDGNREAA